jgi:SAM-dependent methyltransferase
MVHGVSTRHSIPLSKLDVAGDAARHAMFYEASDPKCLRKLIRSLNIACEKYEFIDLGAGKGRSLLVAAEFPFRRIRGSELSPLLCGSARGNCEAFRSRKQACDDLEVLCGDAAKFCFSNYPLVIYLFNPFTEFILSRVLDRLEESWNACPRDVFVIYHNPLFSQVIEGSPIFELFLSGTDRWDYRNLAYAIFRAKPVASSGLRKT